MVCSFFGAHESLQAELEEGMLPPQPDDRAADLVVLHGGHELLVVGEGTAGDDVGVHVGAAELKMYHVTMYSNEL